MRTNFFWAIWQPPNKAINLECIPHSCVHILCTTPYPRQLLFECIFAAFSNLARLNKPYVFWSNLSLTSSESLDGKTRSTNFKQFFMGPSRMRRTIYYTLLLISNFTSYQVVGEFLDVQQSKQQQWQVFFPVQRHFIRELNGIQCQRTPRDMWINFRFQRLSITT